jgi:hypothetical protein
MVSHEKNRIDGMFGGRLPCQRGLSAFVRC